ncbi:hypothetical protein EYF80_042607 [Liparis tanakae]|nr:hypothetical protein EYF80_042607 [Liparis tanakae]
MNGCRE